MPRTTHTDQLKQVGTIRAVSELALPPAKFFGMKKDMIFADKVFYPATIHDLLSLSHYSLLDRKGELILKEFSGEFGKSLISQIEHEHVVFPDRLFSKAIIMSLIIEARPLVNMEKVEDLVSVPLKESEFSKHQFHFLRRFFSSSLVQRLEAKSPELADDLRGYLLNSKVFALIYSVLTSKDAQAQYEAGLSSGNPYGRVDAQEWKKRASGKGVALSYAQMAEMIGRISPKLCHPDLIAAICRGEGKDVNGSYMERMHGMMGIMESMGIMPLGDDRTASFIFAKYSYMAASRKIVHGMEIDEIFKKFLRDDSINVAQINPRNLLNKLKFQWLDDTNKVLFWQGITDASKRKVFEEAASRVGGNEEEAVSFSGYVGLLLSFKLQGCRELGLLEKHGAYRKIIEKGIYAINEGDLSALKGEVHTLMTMSDEIFPHWAYFQKGRDKGAFALFADCPQLALSASGYLKSATAAALLKKMKMTADEFGKNANLFRAAHRKLAELVDGKGGPLSCGMKETLSDLIATLGEPGNKESRAEQVINEVAAALGFDAPGVLTKKQRKQVQDGTFLEKHKEANSVFIDSSGSECAIRMILDEYGQKKVVLDIAGKANPKIYTVGFVAEQIRKKKWVQKTKE